MPEKFEIESDYIIVNNLMNKTEDFDTVYFTQAPLFLLHHLGFVPPNQNQHSVWRSQKAFFVLQSSPPQSSH
jgi:hypothetical protein